MLDEKLLTILVCPADRGPLLHRGDVLYNPRLRRAYRIEDGIPVLLVDEARDVDDDEHARLTRRLDCQIRQFAGEVALQVRRDGLGDLLERQRRERFQAPGCSAPSPRRPAARRRTGCARRPLPGGSSTRGPTSAMITSWRNDRTRLTFAPDSIERSVAMNPSPSSESHSGNSIDGTTRPSSSTGVSRSGPMTAIGSIGIVDRRGEQPFLGAEVVMHQRRVHAGIGGDRADRCLV